MRPFSYIVRKVILEVENGIASIVLTRYFHEFGAEKARKCIGMNGPNRESLASSILLGVEWFYLAGF